MQALQPPSMPSVANVITYADLMDRKGRQPSNVETRVVQYLQLVSLHWNGQLGVAPVSLSLLSFLQAR